jgi:hypothetical protein
MDLSKASLLRRENTLDGRKDNETKSCEQNYDQNNKSK